MPRPDRSPERRRELAPALASTFADLGYRRATTAELASACGVREPILYRLWRDKKAMFIAALEHVYVESEERWMDLLDQASDDVDPAEWLLRFEATHLGELGHYRIVFAGLSETDDPEIREALRRFYRKFHQFVQRLLGKRQEGRSLDPNLAAWAILGLGTMANIGRELSILMGEDQQKLFEQVGRRLLE